MTCEKWLAYVEERNKNYKKRLDEHNKFGPTAMGVKAADRRAARGSDFTKKRKR